MNKVRFFYGKKRIVKKYFNRFKCGGFSKKASFEKISDLVNSMDLRVGGTVFYGTKNKNMVIRSLKIQWFHVGKHRYIYDVEIDFDDGWIGYLADIDIEQ